MTKKKHPGGRPRKLRSLKATQKKIDEYFDFNPVPTSSGLARHLGFVDRQSLIDYINRDDEFSAIIKSAKNRIVEYLEKRVAQEGSVAGPIFLLKNYGFSDKQEIEHSGQQGLNINVRIEDGSSDSIDV